VPQLNSHERADWMGLEMRGPWPPLVVRLAAGLRMRPPAARRIRVRIAGAQAPRGVTCSGAPIQVSL